VSPIKAVFFDVGETLIDETRLRDGWADYIGVERTEFAAALDDLIRRDEHHRGVFERFRPGFDIARAQREHAEWGDSDMFDARDLYPDALPCLARLRELGYTVGIAGNQPAGAVAALAALGFAGAMITASATMGVEKPDPRFFAALVAAAGVPAETIAYVGDRLDNDVLPARAAGMTAILVRRGPWGRIHAARPQATRASLVVAGLLEIPAALAARVRA
jgi:HAD superfamily hydrolase (TIGR01549 family)